MRPRTARAAWPTWRTASTLRGAVRRRDPRRPQGRPAPPGRRARQRRPGRRDARRAAPSTTTRTTATRSPSSCRPTAPNEPDGEGVALLKRDDGCERLVIEVGGFDATAALNVTVEGPRAPRPCWASSTLSDKGMGRFVREYCPGDELPFGVESMTVLGGNDLILTNGDGVVLLQGEFPTAAGRRRVRGRRRRRPRRRRERVARGRRLARPARGLARAGRRGLDPREGPHRGVPHGHRGRRPRRDRGARRRDRPSRGRRGDLRRARDRRRGRRSLRARRLRRAARSRPRASRTWAATACSWSTATAVSSWRAWCRPSATDPSPTDPTAAASLGRPRPSSCPSYGAGYPARDSGRTSTFPSCRAPYEGRAPGTAVYGYAVFQRL